MINIIGAIVSGLIIGALLLFESALMAGKDSADNPPPRLARGTAVSHDGLAGDSVFRSQALRVRQ